MGYRELLRTQATFRRLWFGQLVSQCGDWLQIIAILVLFPTSGDAVSALAGIFIVRMMPSVVWAPLTGVVADRFRRRSVMIAADLARAAVVLGYLFVRDASDVWLVYVLLFAQESLTAFFEPARSAAIPQVVERRALLAANSLAGASWSAMLAIGGSLGGLLVATIGARASFVADSVTFLVSAALIASVHIPDVTRDEAAAAAHAKDRFGLHSLREGARYLGAHAPQAAATMVKALWGLSGGIIFLYSIYAGQVFTSKGHDSATATGILYAGRGIGALMGPLLARRFFGESLPALRRGILLALPLAAAAFLGLAYAPSLAIAALFVLIGHMGGSTAWVNSTQILQLTVPNALQGRVFAVELALLTLAMALSNAFAGHALAHQWLDLRGATYAMVATALGATILWALAMARLGDRLDASVTDRERSPASS